MFCALANNVAPVMLLFVFTYIRADEVVEPAVLVSKLRTYIELFATNVPAGIKTEALICVLVPVRFNPLMFANVRGFV